MGNKGSGWWRTDYSKLKENGINQLRKEQEI
jgi:hypothetical protein